MKRIIKYLFIFALSATFFACSSEDNDNTGLSGTDITAFAITGYESANAEIDATNHTIYLQLPTSVKNFSCERKRWDLFSHSRQYKFLLYKKQRKFSAHAGKLPPFFFFHLKKS